MDAVTWARRVADTLTEATEELARGHPPEPVVAHRIADHLHATVVCHGRLDRRSGHVSLHVWPDLDVTPVAVATATMPESHPVLHHWLQGHSDVAMVSTLVTDRPRWRASEAYARLREVLGVTETGGMRLDDGTETVHMIGLARDRDLTRSEVEQLALLRRPVVALSRHAAWLAARGDLNGTPYDAPPAAIEMGITHRELQVLELLADGLLAVTIGHRLALSPRTIHHHLGHIYAKLGTHDRLSTVIRAQQAGLLAARPN